MMLTATQRVRLLSVIGVALVLPACSTSQAVVPLATDTIQVTVAAHGECDLEAARKIAVKRIAVETVRRGFDAYTITGSSSRSFNPQQEYTARLSKAGERSTALDARAMLGTDWARIVAAHDERSCRA
ncbi:hypothetical protein [Bosea sp. Root381]|uniref:hypothetical protein n=1 Tax=Bosea sp. Root381 TaxID=1736524 RepID=UPI0012E3323A|nr:hypothetical protein [Bosea sp. Root381]